MNSTHLPTRRAFLTFGLGIGTLALGACAPTTRSAPKARATYPKPTQSFDIGSKYDYDGPVRLDTYEKHGKFIPATTEHPAQNVPKPLMPDYINEYSSDGMYAFIAYWMEAVNYAYLTGDLKPLDQVADAHQTISSKVIKLYEEKTGWVIGPQHICSVEFETAGSHDSLKDSSIRERQSIIRLSPDTQIYNSVDGSITPFLEAINQTAEKKVMIGLRYLNNDWYYVNDNSSSDDKQISKTSHDT